MILIDCPAHEGAYDCTPFCAICEGEQAYDPSGDTAWLVAPRFKELERG